MSEPPAPVDDRAPPEDTPPESRAGRAGTCAILGLPNAGKSTLMNRLLGMRLAPVSQKPQTTRNRLLGVHNVEVDGLPSQIAFFDTPGAQRGDGPLRKYMREETLAAAGECDLAVLLIDGDDSRQRAPDAMRQDASDAMTELLAAVRAPMILAINKIDRVDKPAFLPLLEGWHATGRFEELIPISALKGSGIDRLERAVGGRLPEGPPLFPADMVTDRAERYLAGELVREQLFRQLGDELPYASAVVVEDFRERPEKGDVVISAVIHVERDSQKGIVVGKGGQRIKAIGAAGRAAISDLLGCPVHLLLHVIVTPNWSSGGGTLREMGYG